MAAPETSVVDSLTHTKGMSDAMKESVRKAAITICQLREEGRNEEADQLEKMVAESVGSLGENSEIQSRMEELGTTTKMIGAQPYQMSCALIARGAAGEHLTTGILKQGKVCVEVTKARIRYSEHSLGCQELKESKGFLAKCKPMLEQQLVHHPSCSLAAHRHNPDRNSSKRSSGRYLPRSRSSM